MMQEINAAVETVLSWVLLPATLCGACGAILHSLRKGRGVWATVFAAFCGAVISNVVMPLAYQYAPEAWHYTIFFLIGWGGYEFAAFAYALGTSVLLWNVKKHFPGIEVNEPWDGIERRKNEREE